MQSKVRIYAQVLYEALQAVRGSEEPSGSRRGVSSVEQKKRIHAFKEILKKKGDVKMSHDILQEFHRLEEERKGKIGEVISASRLAAPVRATLASKLRSMKFAPQERIDPSLIGGIAIFLGKEFLIDNTILGRLRKLFYGKKLSF